MKLSPLLLLTAASALLAASPPAAGDQPPAFSLPDGDGRVHKFPGEKPAVTVVFFYRGPW